MMDEKQKYKFRKIALENAVRLMTKLNESMNITRQQLETWTDWCYDILQKPFKEEEQEKKEQPKKLI